MRARGRLRAWATATALIGLAGAALGQDSPESLLPPGFGSPPPAAPPAAAPGTPATPATPAPRVDPLAAIIAGIGQEQTPDSLAVEEAEAEPEPEPLEMPEGGRRPVDPSGLIAGYGADAFGDADGRFLATLMRRMTAPVASRWMQIALRRALTTRGPTPRAISSPNWIAARTQLLLKLGEADAARMMVQSIDVDRFSPALRSVAISAALATADPAGLCPLPDGAERIDGEAMWPMIRAMCAAMGGETADASAFQRGGRLGLRPIDEQVAEKVVGAGPVSRRAVVLDWTLVDALTDWRFGLAAAVGADVPAELMAASAPRFRAYAARAAMLPLARRLELAQTAATLGVFSSSDLVDLYGQVLEGQGDFDLESPAGRLRRAFVGEDDGDRLDALKAIWSAAETPQARYAALIATARAAARIMPGAAGDDEAASLIAAMMAAGLDGQAERWGSTVANASGEGGERAWSILAVGTRRSGVAVDADRVGRFVEAVAGGDTGDQRGRLLIAALGGLGRLSQADLTALASEHEVAIGRATGWTRALDRAVADGERGTVLLLAAAAMQTPGWAAVPAGDFYRSIRALKAVGLEPEARMIAAEAMTRL